MTVRELLEVARGEVRIHLNNKYDYPLIKINGSETYEMNEILDKAFSAKVKQIESDDDVIDVMLDLEEI